MDKPRPSPNDKRSTVKNPTSAAYAADRANRANLGHGNLPPPPPPPSPGPSSPSTTPPAT